MVIEAFSAGMSGALWSWSPQRLAVLRLPLCRLCPGLRNPIWFSSGQSVCSGCGSEFMSCTRESELRIVICVPRLTVSVEGQMVLFWMTRVFGLELGVHPPLGLVLDEELLPPHAIAAAIATAAQPLLKTRIICSSPRTVERSTLTTPVC